MERKKKIVLVGIYDTNTVSLAPYILRSYAEKCPEAAARFEIVTREFSIFEHSTQHIANEINKERADIVGFSMYVWNMRETLEVIKNIYATVIVGGPQVTSIELDLLHDNPKIDIVVTGEGESAFAGLLEYFNRKKEIKDIQGVTTREIKTSRGSALDLDSIPSFYEKIFRDNPGISWITIETSRGCPMGCRFCTWSHERKMRYTSIERVKYDLAIILRQPSVKNIYFGDSSLLVNKKRAKEILGYIIGAGTDKSIRYEFSAEQLDSELIDLLTKLPRHEFNFGIQSINERALGYMGRIFQREAFEKNYAIIAKKFKNANNITIDLIYGLPGDNIEGYKLSLNYALSLPEVRRVITNPLIVLPGSAFFDDREKYGLILRDDGSYVVKSSCTFSVSDMNLARKYSFFIAVIYLNYRLRDAIRYFAEEQGKTYIDMIIDFMESLPFDIIKGDDYPDMVPSIKMGFSHRNAAFVNAIDKYDDIVTYFQSFSLHRYDKLFIDAQQHFSEHFYKLKNFSLNSVEHRTGHEKRIE